MDSRGINVVRTSSLYETEAMYVVDQEPFINGACEVSDSPVDNREHHQQLCLCKTGHTLEKQNLTAATI
jgi:7,8-dihydro-6-hydroxymethylpterin-pyrophosphokinase